jgi:lysophospholipase L1-like esterase
MKKLMVIGDSISIQYGPYLKKFLSDRFHYDRKRGTAMALTDLDNPIGANGGDSQMVLDYMQEQENEKKLNYHVLLLNCGLHDIKTDLKTEAKQVQIEKYEQNLGKIVNMTKKHNIQLIWVRTTPVVDMIHNTRSKGFKRFNSDVLEYNRVADQIMSNAKLPSIDLYTFTQKFGDIAYIDHVHFSDEVRQLQAAYIAGYLNASY